jgi:hypothetical protein
MRQKGRGFLPQKIVDTLGFKITPKKNKRSTQPEESEQGE